MSIRVGPAIPILFVRDVTRTAEWFGLLGFGTDFLHGEPPFYGAVSRGAARIHLRHVEEPNFAELAAREPSLIAVTFEVSDVAALHDELAAAEGVEIIQPLQHHPWGGPDFQVRDPDGTAFSFVQSGPTETSGNG